MNILILWSNTRYSSKLERENVQGTSFLQILLTYPVRFLYIFTETRTTNFPKKIRKTYILIRPFFCNRTCSDNGRLHFSTTHTYLFYFFFHLYVSIAIPVIFGKHGQAWIKDENTTKSKYFIINNNTTNKV